MSLFNKHRGWAQAKAKRNAFTFLFLSAFGVISLVAQAVKLVISLV